MAGRGASPAVAPKRWTRTAYDRLIDLGAFGPGERVQLIEGVIVEMAPQDALPAEAVTVVAEALREAFGREFRVRPQAPLALPSLRLAVRELLPPPE
jgi:hypothetical protein